jgi:hypothetical protein
MIGLIVLSQKFGSPGFGSGGAATSQTGNCRCRVFPDQSTPTLAGVIDFRDRVPNSAIPEQWTKEISKRVLPTSQQDVMEQSENGGFCFNQVLNGGERCQVQSLFLRLANSEQQHCTRDCAKYAQFPHPKNPTDG